MGSGSNRQAFNGHIKDIDAECGQVKTLDQAMPDGSVVTLSCIFIQFVDTNASTKQGTNMDMDIGPRIWIGLWMDQAAGREVSKQNLRYDSIWSDV